MSWRFFAACLRKIAVLDPTFSGDVASDFYVIRRIHKNERRTFSAQQFCKGIPVAGIATK
jgi:hypothetical protein